MEDISNVIDRVNQKVLGKKTTLTYCDQSY